MKRRRTLLLLIVLYCGITAAANIHQDWLQASKVFVLKTSGLHASGKVAGLMQDSHRPHEYDLEIDYPAGDGKDSHFIVHKGYWSGLVAPHAKDDTVGVLYEDDPPRAIINDGNWSWVLLGVPFCVDVLLGLAAIIALRMLVKSRSKN